MNSRLCRVAVALVVFPASAPLVHAQSSCSTAASGLQKEIRALHDEAQGLGGAFLVYDGLDVTASAALGKVGKRFDDLGKSKSDPAAPAVKLVRDAQERHKALTDWDERLKRWGEGIAGYKNCLKNPNCSFLDWMRENEIINKELADWLKSIGEGGLEKATERVERASELLKNYTAKVGNAATGAMKTAIDCARADVQAAQNAQTAATQEAVRTAAARPTPRPSAPSPTPVIQKRGGGGGAGKAVAAVLIVGGAVGGGLALASKAAENASGSSGSGSCSVNTLASQSAGALSVVGSNTVCTQSFACPSGSFRVCLTNPCSNSSCTVGYSVNGAGILACGASCSSDNLTAAIQPCANRVVAQSCR